MCSRNHMVLDSITYPSGVVEKRNQTQHGISWNPEYDATNTCNCSNSHMPLSHQLIPIGEKCETKRKKKDTIGNETLPFVPSLTENGET